MCHSWCVHVAGGQLGGSRFLVGGSLLLEHPGSCLVVDTWEVCSVYWARRCWMVGRCPCLSGLFALQPAASESLSRATLAHLYCSQTLISLKL